MKSIARYCLTLVFLCGTFTSKGQDPLKFADSLFSAGDFIMAGLAYEWTLYSGTEGEAEAGAKLGRARAFKNQGLFKEAGTVLDRLTSGLAIEEKRVNDRETVDFRNEITMLLTASYHFYKAFISSQDANNCAFHPSCSTYALETIRLNGLLGIFDAIDRLTRCNGFSPDKYQIHDESQHFHDPVKKIH